MDQRLSENPIKTTTEMARKKVKETVFNLGSAGKNIHAAILGDYPTANATERYLIEALARTLEIAVQADEAMNSEGMIQYFPKTDTRAVSPEWAVLRNAVSDARALAKDLRLSIGVVVPEKLEQGEAKMAALQPKRKAQ